MRPLLPFVAVLCLVAWSCQSPAPLTDAEIAEQVHREAWTDEDGIAKTTALPGDWLQGSAREFTAALERWDLPTELLWDKASHTQLAHALLKPNDSAEHAEQSVRAALLLSLDSSPPSQTSLLTRLERRLAPTQRGRQAAEMVCAAALSKHPDLSAHAMASLQRLATGNIPHPDLDVRVECARAFLQQLPCSPGEKLPLRARNSLRFLIKVLRAETPAQASDPIIWTRTRTVAWPKGRAAQEICRWFPTDKDFRPDGPWQDQVDWALAAEQGLHL